METKSIDLEAGNTVPSAPQSDAGHAEKRKSDPAANPESNKVPDAAQAPDPETVSDPAEDADPEPTPPKLSIIKMFRVARHQNTAVGWCVLCGAILSTTAFKIVSLLFTLLPIAKIYFGATNLCNCPISNFIPFFLLIQGMCTLLEQVLVFANCRAGKNETDTKKRLVGGLFDLFVVIWFIVGSVYIYQIYEPNYDKNLGAYCDKTTYLFAFWSVTIMYALAILVVCGTCCACACLCCVAICAQDSNKSSDPPSSTALAIPAATGGPVNMV